MALRVNLKGCVRNGRNLGDLYFYDLITFVEQVCICDFSMNNPIQILTVIESIPLEMPNTLSSH